jgi:hypothetical protein
MTIHARPETDTESEIIRKKSEIKNKYNAAKIFETETEKNAGFLNILNRQ